MAATLLLVNMIPNSLSGESEQDSEPMLAVNPNNPQQLVGTAFTPNPMGPSSTLAPVFVSTDGGNTWTLNAIVPGGDMTGDITVAFGPKSNNLYAGILRQDGPPTDTQLNILRTTNFQSPAPMQVLVDRIGPDQPFVQAALGGSGASGKDRVYVGDNLPQSTVDYSLNAAAATATSGFKQAFVETRPMAQQNGPQVRTACHPSGVTYVAFYGWRKQSGSWTGNTLIVTADVVVVRDDSGAAGAKPFRDLVDPSDSLPGRLVAQGVKFPFRRNGKASEGQQRLGGDLTIAVNPLDSAVVYLGYTGKVGSKLTLHVRRSTDSGQTWSADLLTVPFGINASLAVNDLGDPGLLYQQLTGTGSSAKWVTHFRQATAAAPSTWSDLVLSSHPASKPAKSFDPYLGDYAYLTSHGRDYYGVFSASNEPDLTHFPSGVTYQRKHNFTTKTLTNLAGATVPTSIDPFFFKVTP
jgi:hypothetical protein